MSEEQNVLNEEKKCNNKSIVIMIVLSLVMSFAALTLSVINTVKIQSGASESNGGKVLISILS